MIPISKIKEIKSAKGNSEAIITKASNITWAQFHDKVEQYIAALHRITQTKKVNNLCFLSPNRVELFYLTAAAASLKITIFGLDYTQSQVTIKNLMLKSDVDLIVISSSELLKLGFELNDLTMGRSCIDLDEQLVGSLKVSEFSSHPIHEIKPPEHPFKAIGFTSGTSGSPKVVVRESSFDARRFGYFTAKYGFSSTDRHLVTIPLYHAAGNGWARLFLNLGATIILPSQGDMDEAASLLISESVTTSAMTPPIAVAISRSILNKNKAVLPGILKFVLVGGKNFPAPDKELCSRVLKGSIHEYYGTTETGVNTIAEPEDILLRPDSVGKPYDGNEIIVVNEKLEPLETGQVGRIGIHSYMNMTRYVDEHVEMVLHNGKKYIITNETGSMDPDGYLRLMNRNASTSGAYVYDLEDQIKRLPCVSDVAVLPSSNGNSDAVMCGFVLKDEATGTPEAVYNRIVDIFQKSKVKIEKIATVDAIPYNPTGKVVADRLSKNVDALAKTIEPVVSSIFLSVLLLVATAMAWGGMFHIASSALTTIDAFHITLVRYGLASIIFLAMLFMVEGWRSLMPDKNIFKLWWYGTLGFAGFSILAFWGLASTRPEHAAIIMALMPLLTVIVMKFWRGVAAPIFTVICIFIALAGVLIVITKGNLYALTSGGTLIPNLAILIGALCWVVYTIGARSFPNLSTLRYTALSAGLGAISIIFVTGLGVTAGLLVSPSIEHLHSVKFELAYLVIIAGVAAVFSWNTGIKIIGAVNGVLFINLVPVSAFIFGWFRGHSLSNIEIFGALVTIGALLANNMYDRGLLNGIEFTLRRSQIPSASS